MRMPMKFRALFTIPLLSVACGSAVTATDHEESLAGSTTEALSSGYYYLRCNATSWGADSVSRLSGTGNQLSLSIHVTQPWMVQNGDSCQLTMTNQLNGWGTSSTSYALSGTSLIVVPGTATVAPSQAQFVVRYPQTGDFTATLDLANNRLTVGTSTPTASWVNLDSSVVSDNGDTHPLGGRVDYVRVDPRNANVVYAATYGGGIWKSTDFTSAQAHWQPITESAPSLAVGGMDIDPSAPDTLYVGLGDPWDVEVGSVIKTTDGGSNWNAAVSLSGTYPAAAGGAFAKARHIRDLAVDPGNRHVLVATDAGLFISSDQGASFQLVDLPNVSSQGMDDLWSIAYVGAGTSGSTWVVAGESVDGGDLWRSSNGGVTWQSGRAVGAFPIAPDGIHRMSVAAGRGSSPTSTAVFVEADAGNSHTWLFRSLDGGQHYSTISGPVTSSFSSDCPSTDNILGGQGWFNRAIAVDPTNSNHVIFGGQLCSVRTLNALSSSPTFSQSSWWIGTPSSPWPFAHADWHGALITSIGGVVRTYAGNDGGLFSSTNVWTMPAGSEAQIRWRDDNAGIRAQLVDWLASGDRSRGLDGLVMGGLSDQGSILGIRSGSSWSFSTVGGGDGQEPALNGPAGSSTINFWDNDDRFCGGSVSACSSGSNYAFQPFNFPAGEGDHTPLFVPLLTDPSGATFLAASNTLLWTVTPPTSSIGAHWTQVGSTGGYHINGVDASPTYAGLYGAAASNGIAVVVRDGAQGSVVVSSPIPTGADLSSISFAAQVPAGQAPGDTYIVAASGQDSPPAGHIYRTTDRGRTWTALGTQGLPNVAVDVARFDPSDTSNRRIYAGTFSGVYVSVDAGSTWALAGTGMPNVRVRDLVVSLDGSLVRVATRGRGIWELATR